MIFLGHKPFPPERYETRGEDVINTLSIPMIGVDWNFQSTKFSPA